MLGDALGTALVVGTAVVGGDTAICTDLVGAGVGELVVAIWRCCGVWVGC